MDFAFNPQSDQWRPRCPRRHRLAVNAQGVFVAMHNVALVCLFPAWPFCCLQGVCTFMNRWIELSAPAEVYKDLFEESLPQLRPHFEVRIHLGSLPPKPSLHNPTLPPWPVPTPPHAHLLAIVATRQALPQALPRYLPTQPPPRAPQPRRPHMMALQLSLRHRTLPTSSYSSSITLRRASLYPARF